jgi:Cd2+/Zn2+-exporting ATPase
MWLRPLVLKVFGGLLPENKSEKWEHFKRDMVAIAMVGDGYNNAPRLELSIVMGAASAIEAILP